MYTLQKYSGRKTKHTCPACGRPFCFVYYVNEDGVALDPTVGRCDHQNACGYHLKPREFFTAHPGLRIPDSWKAPAPVQPRRLCTIDKEQVRRFRSNRSTLFDFLAFEFQDQRQRVEEVAALYQLGALATGATIFWQIDKDARTRTGKVMDYRQDGHRVKDKDSDRVTWCHSLLKRDGILPQDFELTQCFFGEHLLRVFPDWPVFIVESEKTALICSICYPERVWLSTGGKYNLTGEKMDVLKGRKVYIIPDADALEKWREDAAKMREWYDLTIVDPGYTEEDKEAKHDLADIILKTKRRQ